MTNNQQAAREWLPIESAPKSVADGRHVDGIFLLGFIPEDALVDSFARISVIWWEPLLRNSQGGRGKWVADCCDVTVEVKPTHWQPLPAPPRPTQESEP